MKILKFIRYLPALHWFGVAISITIGSFLFYLGYYFIAVLGNKVKIVNEIDIVRVTGCIACTLFSFMMFAEAVKHLGKEYIKYIKAFKIKGKKVS